jgi:acetyl-CoA C-acetyltransferase
MESMSNCPYLLTRVREGLRMGDGTVIDSMIHDGLWDSFNNIHMGLTGEHVSEKVPRDRARNRIGTRSTATRRPRPPPRQGFFPRRDSARVDSPEEGRPDCRVARRGPSAKTRPMESLARLKPAFKKDGTVTAGNAPGVNDGAAAVVVMGADVAARLNLKPLARVVGYATAGLEPKLVMMTPVEAVRKLNKKTGWNMGDADLLELNEAFAVQAVAVTRELGLDPARVNVQGGAVALGHPIGASGARILTTLLYSLKRQGKKRGIATLCLGGGNGVAMAVDDLTDSYDSRSLQTIVIDSVWSRVIKSVASSARHDGQRHCAGLCAKRLRRASASTRPARPIDKARATIEKSLGKFVEKGKLTAADRDASLAACTAPAHRRAWRRGLRRRGDLRELDAKRACCPSSTPSRAGRDSQHQHLVDFDHAARRGDQAAGQGARHALHEPVPLMTLVELVAARRRRRVDARRRDLCKALGKTPVEAADYPGFISNRILMPMINEAIYAVMEGVGTPDAIDTVMKLGMNHPMGPLTLADFIGLDVCLAIMNVLHDGLGDPKYRACPLLKRMVAAGSWGEERQGLLSVLRPRSPERSEGAERSFLLLAGPHPRARGARRRAPLSTLATRSGLAVFPARHLTTLARAARAARPRAP